MVELNIPIEVDHKRYNEIIRKLSVSFEDMGVQIIPNKDHKKITISILDESKKEFVQQAVDSMITQVCTSRQFPTEVLKLKSDGRRGLRLKSYPVKHRRTSMDGKKNIQIVSELIENLLPYECTKFYSPSLMDVKTLKTVEYMANFPQNLYLVSEFPHSQNDLYQYRADGDEKNYTRLSDFALTPAVCFHCYSQLQNTRLDDKIIFSTEGNCYRHESKSHSAPYRMNEFTMKEFVIIGKKDEVVAFRKEMIDRVWHVFAELDLKGKIESANDPFYYSEDLLKSQHQLLAKTKYELIVDTDHEEFSISSFNYLGDSLCKKFNITDGDGEYLHSACIAFGLDRWVYTLIHYFGSDAEDWPLGSALIPG